MSTQGFAPVSGIVRARKLGHGQLTAGRDTGGQNPGKPDLFGRGPCPVGDQPAIRDPDVELSHTIAKMPDELLFADTAWEGLVETSPQRPVIRLDLRAITGNDAEGVKQSLTRPVARQALLWYCRGQDPGIEPKHLRDATGYSDPPQGMLERMISALRKQRGNPVVPVDEYHSSRLKLLGSQAGRS